MTRSLSALSGLAARLPRTAAAVRAGLVLLVPALAAAAPAAAQGPDTLRIVNRATATFRSAEGEAGQGAAESVVFVKVVAGVRLAPPHAVAVRPGERRVLRHVLTNQGTGPDRFALSVTGPAGWGLALHLDLNGDGVFGPDDAPAASPLPLARGDSAVLLLVADVPGDAPDVGDFAVDVRATSTVDPTVSAAVRDDFSVRRPLPSVTFVKTASAADATAGDTLVYTLSWANRGDAATSTAVTLADTLPAGVRYVAGSLRLGGAALTDAADADAGSIESNAGGRETVRLALGVLSPAAAGTATFRVVVAADAAGSLVNTATLSFGTVSIASPGAVTRVSAAELGLEKTLLETAPVRLGGEVSYRLSWTNRSSIVGVRDAVLTDTLPAGLAFVRADGSPEVDGQIVRWRLGTLAPGATGSVTLTARAMSRPENGVLVNRAVARGANAAAVAALAADLEVMDFQGDELEVSKAAGVLEAGLGDAVPYAVTLHNRGPVPISGIVVHDRLPEGVRYLPERLTGADSARLAGRDLTVFYAGPLAPGAKHVVRYAVVVASPGDRAQLENVASATAEGARVRSDTARAWVRLRRGFAMQARVVIGKVWVDRDGDGRQQSGEPGLAGVDVWSEDGEVVTTDRDGRYSFPSLRPGSHVLRLDTLGLAGRFTAGRDGITASVRLDGWTTPRVNFGVVPRPGVAIVADGSAIVASPTAPAASITTPSTSSAPTTTSAPRGPAAPNVGLGGATPAGPVPASVADTARPRAAADTTRPLALSVTPLRTADERQAEEGTSFAAGPVVRIASPADGTVVSGNRLYVGVKGEPGAAVRLFRGDKQVGEGTLRPDGRMDFVGVALEEAGPHSLRVWMRGTFGTERWDSVAVHRSGAPARFETTADAPTLHAGAKEPTALRARVRDRWDVPVAGALVTVESRLASPTATDADASSVGMQLRTDADGWLSVPLRPGHEVGAGELRLAAGEVRARLPFRVYPETRALIATGAAQVGVGAAPEAFGSLTVRGTLDGQTAVSVSVDSRRDEEDAEFFGRGYDPLDEGRYPTFGDGSERRVLSSATQRVSARLERGFDRLEVGDVETPDFGGDARLGSYRRALTGFTARLGTGAVVWEGFGSYTDQVLSQRQLRGDGTSGPYRFGGTVRAGTERVAVEIRARDNAARVVARQELVRFNDYQIDYSTGDVLLNRPVPSEDPEGNPVFVVATLERRGAAERRFVGGVRMEVDATRIGRFPGVDSLGLALQVVRDGSPADAGASGGDDTGRDLVGGGLRLRSGAFSAGGELLRGQAPDSSAWAGRADVAWTLSRDRARLAAEWLSIGRGFASDADPRLSAGLMELRVSGDVKVTEGTRVRLTHERQRFDGYGVERRSTLLQADQTVAGRKLTAQGGVSEDEQGAGTSSTALGRVSMAVTPEMDVWLEGTRNLSHPAGPEGAPARPDQVGAGLSYRVFPGARVEATHRRVAAGDSTYALTGLNVRTELLPGSQVWGGVERADAARASHSAVLGWSQRLSLAGAWALSGTFERRFGLERAPLLDPSRALPFAQAERDRWSGGLGVEFLPRDSAVRFSLRGETHDGELGNGFRLDAAADASLGRGMAVLTRHDWLQDDIETSRESRFTRRDRSLLGLAMRPAGQDALNMLAKVEWRRTLSPLGGGLLGASADQRRLIGAMDAVWEPGEGTELAARYAVRWATVGGDTAVTGGDALASTAHYMGLRAERDLRGQLRARLDGRLLLAAGGAEQRWNVAPSLLLGLGGGVEAEAGWRFGGLLDPDFAAQGGSGFFATLGVRFTEGLFGSVADYWRGRILRDN